MENLWNLKPFANNWFKVYIWGWLNFEISYAKVYERCWTYILLTIQLIWKFVKWNQKTKYIYRGLIKLNNVKSTFIS